MLKRGCRKKRGSACFEAEESTMIKYTRIIFRSKTEALRQEARFHAAGKMAFIMTQPDPFHPRKLLYILHLVPKRR